MIPSARVDAEGVPHLGLQGGPAGDDLDCALAGGERDEADPVELTKGAPGREVLEAKVRVADIGPAQVPYHEL